MRKDKIRLVTAVAIGALVAGLAWAEGEVEWGYVAVPGEDILLPDQWASAFPNCGGNAQSPIDLVHQDDDDDNEEGENELTSLDIDYHVQNSPVVLNNGHTVEVEIEEGSSFEANSHVYELVQFHFHTQSEHALNGKLKPMELHFVHSRGDGRFGVIGVFMREGAANATFQKILDTAPEQEGEAHINGALDPAALLPDDDLEYFRYDGSLTTPACGEVVDWHVLEEPIEVSAQQVATFRTKFFAVNNRPLQPLNGRQVRFSNDDN